MELLCRGLKSWEGRRGEGRRESSTDWHSFPRITWCVILYVWSQLIFYFSWKLIRSIDKGDRAPLARSGVAPSSCKVKNNHSQPRRHMLTWGVSRKGWRVVFWFAIQATERSEGGRLFDGWLSRTASGVVWLGRRETSAGLPRGSTTTIILQSRGNTPKDVFIRMRGGDTSDGNEGFVSSGTGVAGRTLCRVINERQQLGST